MKRVVLALVAGVAAILAWPASPASAHPLGNFSVNQYAGLTVHPDRVDVAAVVDFAEIPTLQDRPAADAAGAAPPPGGRAQAGGAWGGFPRDFAVTAGGHSLRWTVSTPTFAYTTGSGGL